MRTLCERFSRDLCAFDACSFSILFFLSPHPFSHPFSRDATRRRRVAFLRRLAALECAVEGLRFSRVVSARIALTRLKLGLGINDKIAASSGIKELCEIKIIGLRKCM